MKTLSSILILFLAILPYHPFQTTKTSSIQQPTLLWKNGGCKNGYCQTGWYSSPAVANLDGDPQAEVIGAAYSIYVLDGLTGAIQMKIRAGHTASETTADDVGRTWPDVVLADVDNNGSSEIVSAHGGGYLSVYTKDFNFYNSSWPRQVTPGYELRSLAVSDLDGNGDLEILTASTRTYFQWHVYEHTGTIRTGWPQISSNSDTNGYTAGCFNQDIAAGDIDHDGKEEIIGPSITAQGWNPKQPNERV